MTESEPSETEENREEAVPASNEEDEMEQDEKDKTAPEMQEGDNEEVPVEDESLSDRLIERLERSQEELATEGATEELETTGEFIELDDEDVVVSSLETLLDKRQDEKYEPHKFEEAKRLMEVEVDIYNPYQLIEEFQKALNERAEEIYNYLEENSIFKKESPRLEKDEEELFTYIVDVVDDYRNGRMLVLGGADTVYKNLFEEMDLSRDEEFLLKEVHQEAARRNGYDRHLLLDNVLFLPLELVVESPE